MKSEFLIFYSPIGGQRFVKNFGLNGSVENLIKIQQRMYFKASP